jgi:hypothetical protein
VQTERSLSAHEPTDLAKASAAAKICVSIASRGSMLAAIFAKKSSADAAAGGATLRAVAARLPPAVSVPVGTSLTATLARPASRATCSLAVGKTADKTGDRIVAAVVSARG